MTFLFVGTLVYDRAAWHVAAAVAVGGAAASWFAAELYATAQHHKLLLTLYRLLNPKEFVALYEPLLKTPGLRPNIRLTLMAYLSNGYAALGDFARAERLLDEAADFSRGKLEDGFSLLAGNRCAMRLACGDAASARESLDDLDLAIAEMPCGKKRKELAKTRDVLGACLAIAERRCSHNDAVFLERKIKGNASPLYRLDLLLWLARAHLALGERVLAEPYLEQVAVAGGELRIGREARKLMKECGDYGVLRMDNLQPSF